MYNQMDSSKFKSLQFAACDYVYVYFSYKFQVMQKMIWYIHNFHLIAILKFA